MTELFREKIDILLLNGQPSGHFVSAVLVDLVRRSSQCLHQIEAFDAAAATFTDTVLVNADHNCGPMILVDDARGHDSENTGMPASLENDNRRIACRIELLRDLLFRRG